MEFMHIILILLCVVSYFYGVKEGRKKTVSEIEDIISKKLYKKKDLEDKLNYEEPRFMPHDDSKRSKLDKEQWERDKKVLLSQIEDLEIEIKYYKNLFSQLRE